LETDTLERYLITKKIIEAMIEDKPTESIYERMAKECSLPVGNFGKIRFREQDKLIRDMFNKLYKVFNNRSMKELLENTEQFSFDVKINNCTLNCELNFVQMRSHQFCFDAGKFNGKRAIEIWLKHLALCCEFPCVSYCLFRDKAVLLNPVEISDAKEKLNMLANIFMTGLKTPIPFLPQTSFEYAKAENEKLEKAKNAFFSDDYNQREDRDFYIKLCFDETIFENNLVEEFKTLSKTVFLNYWKDEK